MLRNRYIFQEKDNKLLTQSLIKISLLGSDSEKIVRVAIFINPSSEIHLTLLHKEIESLKEVMGMAQIPFVYVYQKPADDFKCIFEVLTISEYCTLTYKTHANGTRSTLIESDKGTMLYCHSPNAFYNYETAKISAEEAFRSIDELLVEHQMTFGDVIRQWSYIENILDIQNGSQGYQVFNETRKKFYNSTSFPNGYPSATGIGVAGGGVFIELIAFSANTSHFIVQNFKNPMQVDAFTYSQNQLLVCEGAEVKSPPLFVRAKSIRVNQNKVFFISGTASIVGENTVYQNDIENQILTTLTHIESLQREKEGNAKNLRKFNYSDSYRVYLKNKDNLATAKRICNQVLGSESVVYLLADVCRNDLMVEIECTMSYKIDDYEKLPNPDVSVLACSV